MSTLQKVCWISNCKSEKSKEISFHTFPRDRMLKIKWAKYCKINIKYLTLHSVICSSHFTPNDFYNNGNCKQRRKLKKNACPTLNLPKKYFLSSSEERIKRNMDRDERARRRKVQEKYSAQELKNDIVTPLDSEINTDNVLQESSDHVFKEKSYNFDENSHDFVVNNDDLRKKNDNVLEKENDNVFEENNIDSAEIEDHAENNVSNIDRVVDVFQCHHDQNNEMRVKETVAVIALTELMQLEDNEKDLVYKKGEKVCDSIFSVKKSSIVDIIKTDEELSAFTGIKFDLFNNLLKAFIVCEGKVKTECDPKLRVLMCLCKLKLNLSFLCLLVLFGMYERTCSAYFYNALKVLAVILKSAVYWPDKEETLANLPKCFKNFKNTRDVLDCTEIPVQRPTCLKCRLRLYSHYKGTETVKVMLGVSPSGQIIFISNAFGGRASDKAIFCESGILDKLLPGIDAVMIDKGFSIENECMNYNIKIFMPPKLNKAKQFTLQDFQQTKEIAAARVHVERVIQRMKIFKICQSRIQWNLLPHLDNIFTVMCGLVNLSAPILSDDKFL